MSGKCKKNKTDRMTDSGHEEEPANSVRGDHGCFQRAPKKVGKVCSSDHESRLCAIYTYLIKRVMGRGEVKKGGIETGKRKEEWGKGKQEKEADRKEEKRDEVKGGRKRKNERHGVKER